MGSSCSLCIKILEVNNLSDAMEMSDHGSVLAKTEL